MEIVIDTQKDSKEDLRKLADFLKDFTKDKKRKTVEEDESDEVDTSKVDMGFLGDNDSSDKSKNNSDKSKSVSSKKESFNDDSDDIPDVQFF